MSGRIRPHSRELLEDQGRRQGICPDDHVTDIYPGKGHLFTTHVVLQGLVADGCVFFGLIRVIFDWEIREPHCLVIFPAV